MNDHVAQPFKDLLNSFINECATDCVNATGYSEAPTPFHGHYCVNCGDAWKCQDETCEPDALSKWDWSERNCLDCEGNDTI